MSSAAKLRKYGRGTAVVASAALVMTSFGPAAFAAWDDSPQVAGTDSVSQAATGVGIVDADKAKAQTQGATLVQAGQSAQALSDVRLVLPNSFKKGDVVDLRLFDRSATETQNGRGNSGPSTKMEFSADPTSDVSGPAASNTVVAITNAANEDTKGNTEGTVEAWAAGGAATGEAAKKPSVTPAFDISRVASTGSAYKDTIRLTVNTDPSTGDPNAKWVVTVKGLKVDLGANVTPGGLRLVPFAYNTDNNKLVAASSVFAGNIEDKANLPGGSTSAARAIGIYTTPGYVSPVTFEAGSPNITASAGEQSIGDLLIKETNAASLLTGTYTVNIDGATLTNKDASSIKAAIENGGTGEAVTVTGVSADKKSFTFSLASADAAKISTLKFSGLLLTADNPGKLTFRLSGGSVDQYLANPAGTSSAIINNGTVLLQHDDAFLGQVGDIITVGTITALNPVVNTAAAGALTTGDYRVVASGTTLELRDKSDDIVARSFDGTTWVGNGANGYSVTPFTSGITRPLVAGETVRVRGSEVGTAVATVASVAVGGAIPTASLPDATYTLRRAADNTWGLYAGAATTPVATAPDAATAVFTFGAGNTITVTNPADGVSFGVSAAGGGGPAVVDNNLDITGLAQNAVSAITPAADAAFAPPVTETDAGSVTMLPTGAYVVRAYRASDGTTSYELRAGSVTGALVARSSNGVAFTLAAPYAGTLDLNGPLADGATPLVSDGQTLTVTNATATATTAYGATPTATQAGSTPLAAGATVYTVNRLADGTWTITGPGSTIRGRSTDGTTFTLAAPNSGTLVLSAQVPSGTTFTIATNTAPESINQRDIVAPLDAVTQLGTVSAGTASIGGTNRFGTAARIAKEYVESTGLPYANTAIVVNGLTAPDALSASFLSQREGAPILLTAPGQLPSETVEALRELGVRKVYIVGGQKAVGSSVFNALKAQDAYMYDEASKAIKPRGDKLEVVQLGGDNRYQTNWRVNTYAAAQTASKAPVGKIAVGYGQPLLTTAMVARSSTSNDFVDALSASVLSAGRTGGLEVKTKAGDAVTTVKFTNPTIQPQTTMDANRLPAGTYRINSAGTGVERLDGSTWVTVGSIASNVITPTGNATNPIAGTVTLTGNPVANTTFTVTRTEATNAVYGYDTTVANTNALPTILTTPGKLVPEAAAQFKALHIQHALLIGSDDALSKQVNDDVAAANATSYRIEGKDRWETAANVNRFAMAPVSAAKAGDVPGLGFDGDHRYANLEGTQLVDGEMVAYLANGLRFPDALVAGPWVSRSRNAMLMTLANELPEPTKAFLSENAAKIDRAAGLGQGDVVSTKVIAEANRIASTK